MELNDLVGKKITSTYINKDKTVIRMLTDSGVYDLTTEADCCSESWIEHVTEFDELEGSTITGIKDVTIGEVLPTRQESDQLYMLKIKHSGYGWRECGIEFRNSSNGYYGGWMELSEAPDDLDGFDRITEDF